MESQYTIQSAQIFTLFFIMLGPARLLGPFGMATFDFGLREKRVLAVKTGVFAFIFLIFAGFVGGKILEKWNVGSATLLLGAGLVFFLTALPNLLHRTTPPELPLKNLTPSEVALSMLITPYGMAAVIVLISMSQDTGRLLTIVTCLAAVIVLDVLAMCFNSSKSEDKKLFMRIFQSVLGTLQFALSIEIILRSLELLGILSIAST